MRTWQDVRVPGARIGRLSSKWIKFASVKQPWSTHTVRFIQDLTVQENGSHSFTGRMHIRAFSRNRAESFSSWRALCSSPSTSQIHATAQIHPSATVGAFSVISERVQIGPGTVIGSGCVLGPDVVVGSNCRIEHQVTVSNCSIGNDVVLWSGVRVGQDGFGFLHRPASQSKKDVNTDNQGEGPVLRKPQTLRVILHDGVELGANTTVDRGSWRDTEIGAHTKIDNQVQIAHNVLIGKACFIAAQTGIAGSVSVGDWVQIGGQVGIAQHLSIASRCMIAGKSGVMASLKEAGAYGGAPAVPIREWHKQTIALRREAKRSKSDD